MKGKIIIIIIFVLIFLVCIGTLLAGLYYYTNTKEFLQYNISNPFYSAYTLDGTINPTTTPKQLTLDGTNATAPQIMCPVGFTAEIIKSTFNILDPFYTCTNGSEVNSFRVACGDINYFINDSNKMAAANQEAAGSTCQPTIVSPIDGSTIASTGETGYTYQEYNGFYYCLPTTFGSNCPSGLTYPTTVMLTGTENNCVNSVTCADLNFVNTAANDNDPYKTQFPFQNEVCMNSYCSPMRLSTPFLASACNGKQYCENIPLDLTGATFPHGPYPCNDNVPVADCTAALNGYYMSCNSVIDANVDPYCKLPKTLGANTLPSKPDCTEISNIDSGIKNILHGYSVSGLYRCIPESTNFSITKMFKYLA